MPKIDAPERIWLLSPITVFIGENTIIGNNHHLLPGSSILGNVQIGNNNIIHPNCVIYENTTLKNNCDPITEFELITQLSFRVVFS